MKWALDERPLTRSEAATFIATTFAVGHEVLGMPAISVDPMSEAIGFSGCRRCAILGVEDVEFGWVIAKPHQGRGYATALGYGHPVCTGHAQVESHSGRMQPC